MGRLGRSNRAATQARRAASSTVSRILVGVSASLGMSALHLGLPEAVHGQAVSAEMFRGSADHRGELDTQGVEDFGRIAWRFETHGPVRSTPVMRDGTVFFGSTDGHLYALDAEGGSLKWAFRAGDAVASSPAIVDDFVIFGDRTNTYWALDRETGAVRWSFATGPDKSLAWGLEGWDYHTASVTIDGQRAYFGSGDGGIYAVDWRTGEEHWRVETSRRIRSTPAVVDGVVYIGGGDGWVRAIAAEDGNELWAFQTSGVELDAESAGFDRTQIQASPAVVDGTVYIGSRDASLYALDAATGEVLWHREDGSAWVVGSAAISGDRLFNGRSSSGNFRGVNRHTGEELWVQNAQGAVFASPTVVDDLVYVSSGAGWVWAFDIDDGSPAWGYRLTRGGVYSSPLVRDGRVYLGADDGWFYAIEPPQSLPSHRVVFWDDSLSHRALVGRQEHDALIPDYFASVGFERMNTDALASFLAERIDDGAPSVVVFGMSHLPEELARSYSEESLIRRYLDRGGKVVWMGYPPGLFLMDEAGQGIESMDASRPSDLLGLDFSTFNSDVYGVELTDQGRDWGLTRDWLGNGSVALDEPTEVLARNEVGQAAAWVKRYGGAYGTGFVLLPPTLDASRLAEYRWVAELGVTWSGRSLRASR